MSEDRRFCSLKILMRIGDYFVEAISDVGENAGGYFCRIYDTADAYAKLEGHIDEHCVSPEDLKLFGGLEAAMAHHLGVSLQPPV